MRTRRFLPIVLLTLATGCGYNRIVNEEQQVEASWGQVENQLQRRADLIPNLVEAVQQYNSDVRGIPGSWWARIGGFPSQKEYFKSEAAAKTVPKVSFQR